MKTTNIPVNNIKTALFCERKLFIEEILKMQPPRSKYDLKRAIINEALKYTNRAEPGVVKSINQPMSEHSIADKYFSNNKRSLQEAIINHKEALAKEGMSIIDTSKQLWQEMIYHIKARIKNTYHFMTANRVYGNDLWWELVPKITYNIKLENQKHNVSITVHRLDNYPHAATPYVLSKQQAPEKGLWYGHRYELALAMLALAEQGLTVQEGIMLYNEGRTIRELELTKELEEQTTKIVEQTRAILASHSLPNRTKNQKKCDSCIHRKKCYDDAYMAAKMHDQQEIVTF